MLRKFHAPFVTVATILLFTNNSIKEEERNKILLEKEIEKRVSERIEDEKKNFSAVIAKPSVTTISYGDSIILHAEITGNLPAGAFIEWSTDNGNFEKVASNDGMSCRLTPKSKGNTTVKLRVVSAKGEIIAEDEQVMTSKAGFFDKIIGFFKKLFGLTKTIPQLIRKAF